jgi:hypothetical protein
MPDEKQIFIDLLKEIEKTEHAVCVQCGYCCTKIPCNYGHWNADRTACAFLVQAPDGIRRLCSKREEIIALEKHSKYPMFWGGCGGALYNTYREDVIKKLKDHDK